MHESQNNNNDDNNSNKKGQKIEWLIFGGGNKGHKEGKLREAMFFEPRCMQFDSCNNLLVAEKLNHDIRKISPEGMVF